MPLLQVTVSEEGSMSGSLQRSKKSKRSWKRLWFLLKDKVLYTYRAQEVRGEGRPSGTAPEPHPPSVSDRRKSPLKRCLCWGSR